MAKNFLFVSIIAGGALVAVPTSSLAKDCSKYGATAVAQNQQNQQMKCGYSGLAWHGDFGAHFGWCLIAPSSQVRGATNVRKRALGKCAAAKMPMMKHPDLKMPGLGSSRKAKPPAGRQGGGGMMPGPSMKMPNLRSGTGQAGNPPKRNARGSKGTSKATCRRYANRAVKQGRYYLKRGCRLSGRSGYKRYYNYCRSVPENIANNEWARRGTEGNACIVAKKVKRKAPPKNRSADKVIPGFSSRCDCYAEFHAKLEKFLKLHYGCRFSGKEGWQAHYNYCKSVPDHVSVNTSLRRRIEGQTCVKWAIDNGRRLKTGEPWPGKFCSKFNF